MTLKIDLAASAVLTLLLYLVTQSLSLWLILPMYLVFFFGLLVAFFLPCLIGTLKIDKEKPIERYSRFFSFYSAAMLDIAMTCMRVKIEVNGREKLPKSRFLFVGNHRSNLDPITEIFALRKSRVGFIAKKELFDIPIIGRLMHRIYCLSLNRGTIRDEVKTIGMAADIIKSGESSIGIYPEGTRNHEHGLLPFKNGAFKIAKKADCPIVVGVIRNSETTGRNFPFKRTHIKIDLIGVLDKEHVSKGSTAEIGTEVRAMMEMFLFPQAVNN